MGGSKELMQIEVGQLGQAIGHEATVQSQGTSSYSERELFCLVKKTTWQVGLQISGSLTLLVTVALLS